MGPVKVVCVLVCAQLPASSIGKLPSQLLAMREKALTITCHFSFSVCANWCRRIWRGLASQRPMMREQSRHEHSPASRRLRPQISSWRLAANHILKEDLGTSDYNIFRGVYGPFLPILAHACSVHRVNVRHAIANLGRPSPRCDPRFTTHGHRDELQSTRARLARIRVALRIDAREDL